MPIDARHVWIGYLLIGFVAVPIVFVIRYRRSPFVARVPPSDTYGWIEALYAVSLSVYTAWLLALPPALPVAPVAGFALAILGLAVVLTGSIQLGPHWRIGQDRSDLSTERVTGGLYRVLPHPIYAGLILVGAGVALLDDSLPRAALMMAGTGLYTLVQSGEEAKHWAVRAAGGTRGESAATERPPKAPLS
ncbi:MAG: methyltransferase [Planctomycetota bacterium]